MHCRHNIWTQPSCKLVLILTHNASVTMLGCYVTMIWTTQFFGFSDVSTDLHWRSSDGNSCCSPYGNGYFPTDAVPSLQWGNRKPNFQKKRATSSGASQKFHPSESLILTMQRANCTNWVAFWIVTLSQRVMKSAKHKRHFCYCPALRKVLAPSSEEHYAQLPDLTLMSSKSTWECAADADAWKRTTEWNLRGRGASIFHTIALFHTSFHIPLATWRCHC